MRTILITGAAGFLGRHLVSHFDHQGWRVCGLVRKIDGLLNAGNVTWRALELPSPAFSMLLAYERPDVIIHAAASANVGASMSNPAQDFTQSVVTWNNVLDGVRLSQLSPKILLLSSAAVYGDPKELPIKETAPLAPISPYGCHKRMCEEMGEYYVRLYGLAVTGVRIFSAYGPGLRRQILWDIVQQVRTKEVVELGGTGEESRDFIFASDIARAIQVVTEHGFSVKNKDSEKSMEGWQTYNIGTGTSTTISTVAGHVVDALGSRKRVRFNGQRRSGDPAFWQADVARLHALGFAPSVSISHGIQHYARWAQENGYV